MKTEFKSYCGKAKNYVHVIITIEKQKTGKSSTNQLILLLDSLFSKSLLLLILFLLTISMTACGPSDTTLSANNSNSYVVMKVSQSDPTDECPNGGISIDTGIDGNGNGILDLDEVDETQVVCNGQNGQDGQNGANGNDGLTTLISVTDETSGNNCPNGGIKVDVGLDDDGNGILDPEEIDNTEYVCDGNDGAVTLISVNDAGESCPNGGKKVEVGIDSNDDGVLAPEEVDDAWSVCNGDDGQGGQSGLTSLISITDEGPGFNCLNGGKKIEVGLDDNGNGGLDSGELDATHYVCNGEDATADSLNSLIFITNELAGGNCENGGIKVDVGLDENRNGILEIPGEVDDTAYVCNGKDGTSGGRLYSVGGNVSGLDGDKSVTLQNNGGDDLDVIADESFSFLTPLAGGLTYNVTVLTPPVAQSCNVTSGTGTISTANITDVTVQCITNIIPSTVIRTPYLQNVTKNSVDVMWGTDSSITSGTLYWGNSFGNYTNSVSSTFFYATEDSADCGGNEMSPYSNVVHTATISGLTAGQTVYYYVSSEDGTVGLNDPSYKATAAPPDNASFRFIAYGDSRPTCANPYPSDNARTRLISTMALHNPDLILHTGDIAINGRLKQFDNFYFAPTGPIAKSTPIFTTIGNHDIRWNGTVPAYRDVYSLPTNSADGTEDYYSFDYGSAHFVSLDTGLLTGGYRNGYKNAERAAEMKAWLANDLNSTTKSWKVVFFHRQYYLEDVDLAWRTIFEENSVSLVLVGHAHHFDSHSRNGVTYIVTGGGGSPLTGAGMAWSSYRIDTFSAYNFVQVDVTQSKLDINVFDIGNILRKNIVLNK